MRSIADIRTDFPILTRKIDGRPLIYLDNASTTQKPARVIDAMAEYYREHCGNPHRGVHSLSVESTNILESARARIARFIGAHDVSEIVFTRNTTEAIHLAMHSWARAHLREGDSIVVSEMEHHSNLLPWQQLVAERGVELRFLPIGPRERLDPQDLARIMDETTKLVTFTHASNSLGILNPAADLVRTAHDRGAVVLLDAAQTIGHMPFDARALDADFIAFSGHKMYGPAGAGVLYGKRALLDTMAPFIAGGGTITNIDKTGASFLAVPHKFEAGTPDVAGITGWAKAADYVDEIGALRVQEHARSLAVRLLRGLEPLDGVAVYGPGADEARTGVVSFNVANRSSEDVGSALDRRGIAVRAGDHCTALLLKALGLGATVRASFAIYNTEDDVDVLLEAIAEIESGSN